MASIQLIVNAIFEHAKGAGMSHRELARRAEISKDTLSMWKRGQIPQRRSKAINAACLCLKIDPLKLDVSENRGIQHARLTAALESLAQLNHDQAEVMATLLETAMKLAITGK